MLLVSLRGMMEQKQDTMTFFPGQKISLKIEDMAFGGEGVGRVGDFVVFIPFVLTGEEVEAEITEVKKKFARAKLSRVITPSPQRVSPQCRYFGDCGGCQYQHLAYSAQLEIKQKQTADIMHRIGGFSEELVRPVVACPEPYHYRNRIMVRSQWDKFKQGLNIGFIRADNRLVVDVEECSIAHPDLNRQLIHVRAHPPCKGGIKVVLRVKPQDWEVSDDGFFQNNFILLPQLVEVVRQCLKESGARYLVDAYCGVGFFSLELASAVERFVGVEYDRMAIHAARKNALHRSCSNGEYLEGKTEELLDGILTQFSADATSVVLDPPRRGCAAGSLEAIKSAGPAQIIHISCHPATLARDLKLLCQDGLYRLIGVTPVDMFPQTQHVECVADLRRIK